MTHEQLISAFAWMSVINLALFTLGLLKITLFKRLTLSITEALFGESMDGLIDAAPRVLMYYYIVILTFNVVPYLALRLFVQINVN